MSVCFGFKSDLHTLMLEDMRKTDKDTLSVQFYSNIHLACQTLNRHSTRLNDISELTDSCRSTSNIWRRVKGEREEQMSRNKASTLSVGRLNNGKMKADWLLTAIGTMRFCMSMHTNDISLGVLGMVDDADRISACCRGAGGQRQTGRQASLTFPLMRRNI